METARDLSLGQYQDLAEFRRQIRRFLHFSEATAKDNGFEPKQHQLLLALCGMPSDVRPTIGELATRLFIQHHSAVELVNRLESTGAVIRQPATEDRREVLVTLTPVGKAALRRLSLAHREELERTGPELARALNAVLRHAGVK
ncbi:MAG: MarR family transcriptional regulator [Candidatus Solibacter sp.]